MHHIASNIMQAPIIHRESRCRSELLILVLIVIARRIVHRDRDGRLDIKRGRLLFHLSNRMGDSDGTRRRERRRDGFSRR